MIGMCAVRPSDLRISALAFDYKLNACLGYESHVYDSVVVRIIDNRVNQILNGRDCGTQFTVSHNFTFSYIC